MFLISEVPLWGIEPHDAVRRFRWFKIERDVTEFAHIRPES